MPPKARKPQKDLVVQIVYIITYLWLGCQAGFRPGLRGNLRSQISESGAANYTAEARSRQKSIRKPGSHESLFRGGGRDNAGGRSHFSRGCTLMDADRKTESAKQ